MMMMKKTIFVLALIAVAVIVSSAQADEEAAAAADDLKSIRRVPRQQQQREDDGWVKSAGDAVRGVGTKIKAAASRVVEHVREAARNFILPSSTTRPSAATAPKDDDYDDYIRG